MGYGLKGISVTVITPTSTSTDPFGALIEAEPTEETVDNVLVDKPKTDDLEQSTRQFGTICDLVLHFPKTRHGSLRGSKVVLPAPWSETFEVIGDPMPYDPRLTPGAHNRKVLVRRVAG